MLLSIALVVLIGLLAGWLCSSLKLPSLIGMVATGIVLGPHVLNWVDTSILDISAQLRQIALIIILSRAGLSLDLEDLKKIGRPALLMSFLPASLEILAMTLLAPVFLGVSRLEAAMMGAVVAAVSPAVIVPKMLKIMAENYGTKEGIPQLILAGASVDDVYVIILFTALTGLASGRQISPLSLLNIPLSIILGLALGLGLGLGLAYFFENFHMRDTVKVLIFLCLSFLLVSLEAGLDLPIRFSALIAIMFTGIGLQRKSLVVARRLSLRFNRLWVGAEVILFVLVGASVDISYAAYAGLAGIGLVLAVLAFRLFGVFLSLLGSRFNQGERIFCMVAYMPKATVQAAIGGIPLAMGLSGGNIILTVAVLSIIITAPLGAFLIDLSYRRFLTKD